MMSQRFQQPEPPNRVNTFMEKVGWPIITIICTMIATIAGLVWIGNIHILDFTWLMLILGLIMVIITISSVWYSRRIRKILQNKYQEDVAGLRKEYKDYMAAYREYVDQEIRRWNERDQASAKEQKERLEEVKKHCMEAIADAENRMDSSIKNTQTIFTGAVKSYEIALDSQKQYLLDVMQAKLKEMLITRQLPDEQEDISTPSQETHDGI